MAEDVNRIQLELQKTNPTLANAMQNLPKTQESEPSTSADAGIVTKRSNMPEMTEQSTSEFLGDVRMKKDLPSASLIGQQIDRIAAGYVDGNRWRFVSTFGIANSVMRICC